MPDGSQRPCRCPKLPAYLSSRLAISPERSEEFEQLLYENARGQIDEKFGYALSNMPELARDRGMHRDRAVNPAGDHGIRPERCVHRDDEWTHPVRSLRLSRGGRFGLGWP